MLIFLDKQPRLLYNFSMIREANNHRGPNMQIRLFDKKNAPAMQGLAIAEIHAKLHGELLECGEIVPPDTNERQGNMLYLKLAYKNGEVRSIWWDDGSMTFCVAYQEPGQNWKVTNQTGSYFKDPTAWIKPTVNPKFAGLPNPILLANAEKLRQQI